ncbi:energy transducer TonB family protein [Palleronia abyssalis]|uniref:TonB C-terminal domain-containing protein n=1 Tax=Palleronia abyssalis TaxID=1501240 RepID=A0A2R8BQX1_9RHOB|nr:energy transducer TonB [Palleronia abyssalis]SPJ22584.1 hypothetical protein PAA8504_00379 [Palleronia abyssalis]
MIPSSNLVKGVAGAVSVMALGAALSVGVRPDPVKMEGGGAQVQARLGTSFADMSQGVMAADPVESVDPPEAAADTTPPDAAEPADPANSAKRAPSAEVTGIRPDTVQPAEVQPGRPSRTTATLPIETPVQVPADLPAVPIAPRRADTPEVEPITAEPTTPTRSPEATQPAEASPPPEPERITGQDLPPGVVVSSRRPPTRTDAFEVEHRRPDPRTPSRQTRSEPTREPDPHPTRQAKGNSTTNARAGSQQGAASQSSQTSQGQRRQSSQAGNAAAANYPGQVMARLSRVGRPSVRARGTAVVAFSVAGSGGLASAGIARSSGSAELDRAAVQLVRRAAPFPPPPPGARRSFSINIAGR